MRMPKEKKLSKLSPNILRISLHRYTKVEYEGKVYDEGPEECSDCGSKEFYLHDLRENTFCMLLTKEGFEEIKDQITRFRCKKCGSVIKATNEPFYKGCLYGKPTVDLCLWIASSMPYNRVENVLMQFGIQVDRDTVKRYCQIFGRKAKKLAGIGAFGENIEVNLLKLLFDVENVEQLREKYPDKKYDAVADETYPPERGAKKKMRRENKIRKWKGEQPKGHPEGICVASSYLAHLQLFASLLYSFADFNWLFARILLSPLVGITSLCTDGEPAYNDSNPISCLIHKFRNLIKSKDLRQLKKELHPDEFSELLRFLFREIKEEILQLLKELYPDLVENGEFIGALSTSY